MNEKYPKLAYRLQLNGQFTFYDVITIIPYLKKLGVTHIYLSPILKARAGSTHCYDIVDFRFVNDELGGEEGLRKMVDQARENHMKILIDIVPNHMAYSLENTYILDFIKTGNPDILRLFDIKQSPFV
ncbi:MAG: alpha-amylase family glycosyl hydrolase, partial [Candidatus Thermoplasmatota archaeon]|nr:alpha-amylase family glycosyl hydrolase [Candidatus Thermoplasmatota archaeon]